MKKLVRSNSDTVFFRETKKLVDEINNNLVYFKNISNQDRKKSIAKKVNKTRRTSVSKNEKFDLLTTINKMHSLEKANLKSYVLDIMKFKLSFEICFLSKLYKHKRHDLSLLSEILIKQVQIYNKNHKILDENGYFNSNIENLIKILVTFTSLNYININETIKSKFFKDFEELALESEYLIKLDSNNIDYKFLKNIYSIVLYKIYEYKTIADLQDVMIKSISQIYISFVSNFIDNTRMISEDCEKCKSLNTYIIIEKLYKLKIKFLNEYSNDKYSSVDDDYDETKQTLNFKQYHNFGKILLDFFTDFLELNINIDIEGVENLTKNTSLQDKCLFNKSRKKNIANHNKRLKYNLGGPKNKNIDLYLKTYTNWKLYYWKSVLYKSNKIKKAICRICEDEFTLHEFILHLCYCKHKSKYKEKISEINNVLEKNCNLLERLGKDEYNVNLLTGKTKFYDNFIKVINLRKPKIVNIILK